MSSWDNYKAADLNSAYKEAFAMHELLRRIGFSPESIYMQYDEGSINVVLLEGGNEYALNVGHVEESIEDFTETWKEFTYAIQNYYVSEEELLDIWTSSMVYSNYVQIIWTIAQAGFDLSKKEAIKPILN